MILKFPKGKGMKKSVLPEFPDEALLAAYKDNGNPDIIGELFKRYNHLIYGVCMKYFRDDARSQDAVMEIFESLFIKLRSQHIENFKSWFYVVAKNHCLMEIRKKGRKEGFALEISEDMPAGFMESVLPLHHIDEEDNEEKIIMMMAYLKELKPAQKECIELMYLKNKSYREISDITGHDIKKVKSYIQNGKRNLKIYFESQKMSILLVLTYSIFISIMELFK